MRKGDTSAADRPSRYHAARQNNGRGWMLLRLDALGASTATILAVDLTEASAREKLADLRAAEVLDPEYPVEHVDAALRAAGGDPQAIGERGRAVVAAALAKRRERSS